MVELYRVWFDNGMILFWDLLIVLLGAGWCVSRFEARRRGIVSSSSSSSFLIISVEGDRDLSASGFELETLFEFIKHELFADSTTPPTHLSVTCQLVMRH